MNNKILPAHILRLYIWDLLKANNTAGLVPVNGHLPIIPIEDEPLLSDAAKTYMIYGYAENNPESGLREIRRGIFSLRVVAHGQNAFAQLGEITTTISRALDRGDASAENVNIWSSNFVVGSDKPFVGIRFTSVDVIYTEGGDAPETEGGPVPGIINIAYRYVTHQNVILPATGGLWS